METERATVHGLVVETMRRCKADMEYYANRGDTAKLISVVSRFQALVHLYHTSKVSVTNRVINKVKQYAIEQGVRA